MTTVTDDFNRADGAVGAAWTMVPTGDGTPTWSIVSNKVRNTTTGGSFGKYARHDTAVGSDDMYAQGVVSSTQANAGSNTGVMCRGQTGATNTSYQVTGRHAGDTIAIWKIVAGTETNLRLGCGSSSGAQTVSVAWASGDTLRNEVVGSLVRGKVNGVLVALTRDTSIATGQRGGLNGYNAAGGELVEFDNFQAGPLDDLVAPYVSDVAVQQGGTGTTLTPTAGNPTAGDLVCVLATLKSASESVSAPAGEGWSQVELASQTGLRTYLFAKIWGLGGQTDDSTPTFTASSGTSGWCLTLFSIRNPAHATTPWTSVASAIPVSGQSSDATTSSATRTAPSVTHTGSHVTLVRLWGSADDNALGTSGSATTNSEGALVFGGADFDVASGGGVAQAMSVREDITLSGATGTASVTETANANDISSGISFVVAIPAAATDLTVANAAQAHAADSPTLTQVHALTVSAAAQAHSAGSPSLTQVHNLAVADATHAHAADNVALGVDLVVQNATQVQSAGSPTLTQDHQLAVANAAQAQAADAPTLTQAHTLVVANAAQAQSAGSVALTQAHSLTVQDATHAFTSGTPTLTQQHTLVVADASQGHTAGSPTLTQSHVLAVADAAQAQSAGSPTVTQVHELAAQDAEHSHAAGNVVLVVGGIDLAVQDAGHAQSAGNVALVQQHGLAVADSAHAHAATSPALTQAHALAVSDAAQSQTAGSVALTQSHALDVQDTSQAHGADNVTLTVPTGTTLTIQDATHVQSVDNVTLRVTGHQGGTFAEPAPGDYQEPLVGSYREPVGLTFRE